MYLYYNLLWISLYPNLKATAFIVIFITAQETPFLSNWKKYSIEFILTVKKKGLLLFCNMWQKKNTWITCIGFVGEAFLVRYALQWLILIGSLILHYCALWLNAFLLDLQGDLKHYWPRETDKGNQLSPQNCSVLPVTVNVSCYLLWANVVRDHGCDKRNALTFYYTPSSPEFLK